MKISWLLALAIIATPACAQTVTASGNNAFTGTNSFSVSPTVPTATLGTNSTLAASTAFAAAGRLCHSILDNGGDNTGTNDNGAAFTNTIALGPVGRPCVYFPSGLYKFTSQVVYTLPSENAHLTVMGSGSESSELIWPSGQGMVLNAYASAAHFAFNNSFKVTGLTFATTTNNAGSGLTLQNTVNYLNFGPSVLDDLVFRSSTGLAGTYYWTSGININGLSFVNMNNINVTGNPNYLGNGIQIQGYSTYPSIAYNISNSNFYYNLAGIIYGNYAQGVSINHVNFIDNYCLFAPNATATGRDQLLFSESQCQSQTAGLVVGTVADVTITGNYFLAGVGGSTSTLSVALQNPNGFTITGNTFGNDSSGSAQGIGIGVTGGAAVCSTGGGTIVGNNFMNMAGFAVSLGSSSCHVTVNSNTYYNNGGNVSNAGGSNNSVGVATP